MQLLYYTIYRPKIDRLKFLLICSQTVRMRPGTLQQAFRPTHSAFLIQQVQETQIALYEGYAGLVITELNTVPR